MKDINDSINELIIQIKKRPGMYIGKNDILLLRAFLDGFATAMEMLGSGEYRIVPLGFHDWVAKKYNLNSSVAGWANIIYEREKESSINKFFELLEEYRLEENR